MTETENFIKLLILLQRARQLLRTIFLEKWKETQGSDWIDCKASGEFFTSGNGIKIYNSLPKSKKALENGNSSEWDLQILGAILKDPIFSFPKETKASIDRIIKIRNEHAHHPTIETFTLQIFNPLWDRLETELISLGDSKIEIDKLKSMDIYSAQNQKQNEAGLKLKTQGNEKFKQNQFDEALKLYSEALNLSDLSSKERSILYLNCCLCYFKIYQNNKTTNNLDESENNQLLDEALRNSKLSSDYDPTWPKPYFRIGLIYEEMKSYKKAVHYFEIAKVFDPTNEELSFHLADTRRMLGIEERMEHLELRMGPKTTEDHFQESFEEMKERGIFNIPDQHKEFINFMRKNDPTLADVHKGHEYRDGAKGIKQNYELAVQYYQKAADQGNPEGMYNLALLIKKGRGTKKDFKKAFELLEKAASQAPIGNEIPKVGVVEAEHSLGLHYFEGIYVEKDYNMAVYWYERASQHGYGLSANNLGLMYWLGHGVSIDLERAEKLFLFAHEKNDPNASVNLTQLYLMKLDPERALLWHERALEMNPIFSKSKDNEVRSLINDLIQEFDKSGVSKWEQKHGLSPINLNQIQRRSRFVEKMSGSNVSGIKIGTPTINFKVVTEYAQKGSETAKIYLKAFEAYYMALCVIDEDDDQFVDLLSQGFQIDPLVVAIPLDLKPQMDAIVNRVLKKTKGQVCKLNEDARICHVFLKGMVEMEYAIKYLTESLQIYPKCRTMIENRGCRLNFIGKNREGLVDLNKAIELEPKNYGLIYLKATTLRLLEKHPEAIKTYKEFLSLAPICNRKIPETYYGLSASYISLEQPDQVELYYLKGLEAEKDQLPFFLPYKSTIKGLVEKFLQVKGQNPLNLNTRLNPIGIPEQNPSQLDPLRFRILLSHRNYIKGLREMPNATPSTKIASKTQKLTSLTGLKPLYLREMDKSKDHLLKGILTVTIVDMICVGGPSVHMIIKDANHDIIAMSVYNFEETYKELINTYKIGCEMQIINPYMRIPMDKKPRIRIDDPRALRLTGKCIENMCRFCFKDGAKSKCAKCDALYCSKQCQVDDWKLAGHKDICFK